MERKIKRPSILNDIIVGLVFLVAGMYNQLFSSEKMILGIVLFITGLGILLLVLRRLVKPKEYCVATMDERLLRNNYKAGYYAYQVALIVNLILVIMHSIKISPFHIYFILGVIFLTGLSTGVFVLLQHCYERKGE